MDLLIDYCIDHTRIWWGKSRPYSLFGAIPFTLFAILAFSVSDISQPGELTYAYTAHIGPPFTHTVVSIPMTPTLPNLTADTQERMALFTTRKLFVFLGSTVVNPTVLKLMNSLGKGSGALGFRIVMIIFGLVGCLLFFFTLVAVKERANTAAESVSLRESPTPLGKDKSWLVFALNIILIWTDFFLRTSAIAYYYIVVVGSKKLSVTIVTIMSIVLMAANFLVPALAGHAGKRNLCVGSAAIQLAGPVVILLAGINHGAILAGAVIIAPGYDMKESIYFSVQAGPVGYGERKTGVDAVGLLSVINGFLGEVTQATTGGISGVLLTRGAYQGGASAQSPNAVLAIKAMYLYIPMLLPICSIVTTLFYSLDKVHP